MTEDYFYQLGDSNLSLKGDTSKGSMFTNKQEFSREDIFYIYTHKRKKKDIQLAG